PESRAARAPGIDVVGVALSSAGLVAFMYGIVEAGDVGWSDPSAIGPALIGLAILAAFVAWEWRLESRPDGEPLVDLSLFSSRNFTWGIILTALGVFALFGVLFALPQYFQAILLTDPQGSGVRLLPVIGGLIMGAVPADRIAGRVGAKVTVAVGFVVVALGLAIGTVTAATSGDGFIATWTFVAGVGAGLAFATAASAAIVEVPAERSGVASALLQAVVKLGPAFGATILGSILNATYQAHVDVASLPDALAATARSSIFAALAVAAQLGDPGLAASAQAAFVTALDAAVRVAAAVAAGGAVLALIFLPARRRAGAPVAATEGEPAAAGRTS
ncbi:MAG TPA: MFS transporter, partial [Candidatus Dormibacteraeota bacterium]|nr:MFS transporter [Candidatus Dormibacteraeota bacterium]